MELFFQRVVDGLASGAIYAAIALALVLIYRSTSLLNFAQGEMAMFSTFIGWMFVDAGLPVAVAIAFAMAISFLGGAAIERFLIRPVGQDNLLAIVIVTIDESTFSELDAQWPFPRAMHGELITRIAAGRHVGGALDEAGEAQFGRRRRVLDALAVAHRLVEHVGGDE